jgi:serine protease SohB
VEYLVEYGIFLAKAVTILALVAMIMALVLSTATALKDRRYEGRIEMRRLNDFFEDLNWAVQAGTLRDGALKKAEKSRKKSQKKMLKEEQPRPRIFVLDFDGDIRASHVECFRTEISALIGEVKDGDEVCLRLESPGGLVHAYGLAASQLVRLRQAGIKLTVCVDKVAASGGYMMACVADRIVAAPFAIIGSIGVVAQIPNFHRLLKKHDVDFDVLTAGEYKRTLTVLGENTEEGRQKFVEELEDTHQLFKALIGEYRPGLDMGRVATGETWYGQQALSLNLVDEISTSDQYLLAAAGHADIFELSYQVSKPLAERLGIATHALLNSFLGRLGATLKQDRI